jgi:adenylosuccinate lyase
MRIVASAVARNLAVYGVFAATERVLMALGRAGADRQEMHEVIREHSLAAWDALQSGAEEGNPLPDRLSEDARVTRYLSAEQVRALLDASAYVGDAPVRARRMADRLRAVGDGSEQDRQHARV